MHHESFFPVGSSALGLIAALEMNTLMTIGAKYSIQRLVANVHALSHSGMVYRNASSNGPDNITGC